MLTTLLCAAVSVGLVGISYRDFMANTVSSRTWPLLGFGILLIGIAAFRLNNM